MALTRPVTAAIARCELTHLERIAIDVDVARAQHRSYEHALEEAGCMVQRIDANQEWPDAVFIEDTALVLAELALIARPGAASRRAETEGVERALAERRTVQRIEAPGTLDGGDVLCVGRSIFVGRSSRTNTAGIQQLQSLVRGFGYAVRPVAVSGCLHLKSAVTAVADDTLLVNREWIPDADLDGFELIDVDPDEPFAANALRVGDRLIHAAAFRRTRERLERRNYDVIPVELSELAKAEGAVTCCSLLVPA
ncbi:MAG: arginine deiminase-related protein [Gemmatimonadota bacterium]|nr:arginine deiminase-related protein [Gemmatimonadota bacterium]